MHAIHSSATTMYSQQTIGMPSTPTRKRKRPVQVSYSEVQEVDANGRLRDVIVIEDTPPPTASATASSSLVNGIGPGSVDTYVPPRRTRAQVAAAKAALSHVNNGATASSSSFAAPPTKKRKRENADDAGAFNGLYKKTNIGIPSGKQWPGDSGAVTGVSAFFNSYVRCH
jgi:dual-specificity kinase